MVTEAPTYRCFLCGFRIDPELCHGSYIRAWKVTVCAVCLDASRGGIQPTRAMVERLRAARTVNLTLNKAGKIDWPERIENPVMPAVCAARRQTGHQNTFI